MTLLETPVFGYHRKNNYLILDTDKKWISTFYSAKRVSVL